MLRILLVAAAVWSMSASAFAEPIRIVTRGDGFASEGINSFVLVGEGFRFEGEEPPGMSAVFGQCVIFLCSPGQTLDLSTHAEPHLNDPELTVFDGQTFDPAFLQGDLDFHAGTATVPVTPLDGFAEITAPFSFTGHLSAFDNPELAGNPLFSTRLLGSGTLSVIFTNRAEFGTFVEQVSYRFEDAAAATPEPGTLVLLGSGLVGLIARKRRPC
jgi:PEP-CTERM motif